jgi:uncharacterized protein (TIGR03000 family)
LTRAENNYECAGSFIDYGSCGCHSFHVPKLGDGPTHVNVGSSRRDLWLDALLFNTGHGNYPGSPGFIPGYGYYHGPGTYPWMDGPGTPFDRRKIEFAVPDIVTGDEPARLAANEPHPPGTALITVKVPAEAELSFNGAPTSQGGSYRRFLTPPLPSGRTLVYTIRARWIIKDAELTRVEDVPVRADHTVTVNFLTSDSWKGRRLETLPKPKPASDSIPRIPVSVVPEQ